LAASPDTPLYNASKFGLRGFALSFAQDLAGTGVGLSIVEPGFIRDAGMFARNAVDLPPGVRTKSPEDVALAVTRAIETGRTEVFVSPVELRVMSAIASVAPGVAAAVQRRLGVAERLEERRSS
jgi:short-subunit dehydrogenase